MLGLIGEKRERVLVKKWLRRFREDRRGVAWVVGVAVISILLMPVVYYPLDYAWDVVFYSVTGGYVFTGTTASAVKFVQVLINYLIVFGLLFTSFNPCYDGFASRTCLLYTSPSPRDS